MTTNELRYAELQHAKDELAEKQRQFDEPQVAKLREAKVLETEATTGKLKKEESLSKAKRAGQIIKNVADVIDIVLTPAREGRDTLSAITGAARNILKSGN